ncbi:MAG: universal stress protein [Planctomycetota bacterium]
MSDTTTTTPACVQNVLLALDGSAASIEAAELLAHLPRTQRQRLTILTVVQRPFVHSSYATGELLDKAYQRDRELAFETYAKVREIFEGANVEIEHKIGAGPIAETIVEMADETDADLLVIGARGHSTITRLLLGSISDYVATHAPCSTLVVRSTGLKESARPLRLGLAYIDSGASVAALQEIGEFPWRTGSEFHLITVQTYLSDFIGERIIEDAPELANHYREVLATAKQALVKSAPNAQSHLIRSDHVGEGLVSFAQEHELDIMVVGENKRTALGRLFLGSTSRFVLRHAPCSVWITRNRVIENDKSTGAEASAVPPPSVTPTH